jgi:hypothetical protein
MHPNRVVLRALWIALVVLAARGAQAHEVRFVASYGDNSNPCTRDAPCKQLQKGISRTPAGGELIVLDSGDFGNGGTIDRSITISAIGVSAAVGGGITIDATDATVVLRGLRLNGAGSDANGIEIVTGGQVKIHVEDCEIQGFAYGIHANTSAYPMLFVANSVVRNNSRTGLYFQTGTPGRLVIDQGRFERNGADGIEVRAAEASITRTIASANAASGIKATFNGKVNVTEGTAEHNTGSGYAVDGSGQMTLERSVAGGNAEGVLVRAGSGSAASARISGSVVTNNRVGLSAQGGGTAAMFTRGNNTVAGNTTDVAAVLSLLAGT